MGEEGVYGDYCCEFCGRKAKTARFGHFVCGEDDCTERARAERICAGKDPDTMGDSGDL